MRVSITLPALMVLLTTAGCATGEKPILSRGWIGGEYESFRTHGGLARLAKNEADSDAVGDQTRGVLVVQRYDSTPAASCGLEEGDLITAIAGEPITSRSKLFDQVDVAAPGDTLKFTVLRDGSIIRLPVQVGEERYRRYGTLSIGLGLSSRIDVIPDPEFNILGLLRYTASDKRLELRAPHLRPHGRLPQQGMRSREGWDLFLGVIGVGRYIEVVSQEAATETSTSTAAR